MFGSRAGNVASVGRVQTPTLAIVYARELEIRNFKPRAYWQITAEFQVSKGTYEGDLPEARLQEVRVGRARPDRPDLGQGGGRGDLRRPARGDADARRPRGEEGQHPGVAPPLRPDDPPAGGEQPLRPLRQAHLPDRAGALRAPQDDHLPADGLPRAPGGLHPDLPPGAPEPPGRPCGPRAHGARGAVARAQQAHLQQRPDFRPLRDHPDCRDARSPSRTWRRRSTT